MGKGYTCCICGCWVEAGAARHECPEDRLNRRDASLKRDDDAVIERRRSYTERMSYGCELAGLSGDDEGDEEDA